MILEGGALQVAKALKGTSINWSKFGPLVEDTQSILFYFSSWQINHVCCEEYEYDAARKLVLRLPLNKS